MEKEIIISIYDSGVYWSFSSGNRIYKRDEYELGYYNHQTKINTLCSFIHKYCFRESIEFFSEVICKLYPQCSKIIWSENGDITIYNILKGGENMAIGKDKTMLQIPVDKRVAKTWNDLVKQLNIKQGDLFAVALAQFLQSCIKKANEEAMKGKTKNVKN